MIELRTLGRGAVRRDGEDLPGVTAQKQRFALFAYLAVEGRASRDRLLALFWPEREEEKARHSLSQALYALRRDLGEECLQGEGDSVQVDTEACVVDAAQLNSAAERGDWHRVIELYGGPFLHQFSLPDASDFEEWLSNTRAGLARLAHQGFRNVIAEHLSAGDTTGALAEAWHWTELEPLDDEAQHTLIGLLAASGERTAALSRFDAYRERLTRELEVEPLEETVALVERVRRGESPEFRPLSETTRPLPERVAAAPEPGQTRPSAGWAFGSLEALWREVRTRRVFQVGLLYLGASWLAMQAADMLIERGLLPNSFFSVLLLVLVAALPIALILAWAYEQPPGERWASLITKVGPLHVLAALFAAALLLLPARFLLNRQAQETAPQIEAGAPPPPTSIAVLYFDDHSEGAQLEYLAESLTEHVIHELAQVSALDVKSRNAVKPFRTGRIGTDSAASLLGVGTLVEGSVFGTREHVRISVQLINALTLGEIRSTQIDGSAEDPFALLDGVGTAIARMLRTWLGVEIRLREMRAGTESQLAWTNVRRAQAIMQEFERLARSREAIATAASLERADSFLVAAEEADGDWIEPIIVRAELADLGAFYLGPADWAYDTTWAQRGMVQAGRALERDPHNARALELRGILLSYLAAVDTARTDSLNALAEETRRQAVDIDPARARAWERLSLILMNKGELRAAMAAAQSAYEADQFLTEAPRILYRLCQAALWLRDWEEATHWCGEGHRRFPDAPGINAAQLTALASPGGPTPDVDLTWDLVQRILATSTPQQIEARRALLLMQTAAVIARAGLADSALATVERARAASEESDPWLDYEEANVRLHLGETERAIELLAAFIEAVPGEKDYIAHQDWWWERLRDDPRFQALFAEPE
jgi:DNA-binding SARP family transcriptional activator/TolB-like protein/tetratricopeptide (TPR) repeat protein